MLHLPENLKCLLLLLLSELPIDLGFVLTFFKIGFISMLRIVEEEDGVSSKDDPISVKKLGPEFEWLSIQQNIEIIILIVIILSIQLCWVDPWVSLVVWLQKGIPTLVPSELGMMWFDPNVTQLNVRNWIGIVPAHHRYFLVLLGITKLVLELER